MHRPYCASFLHGIHVAEQLIRRIRIRAVHADRSYRREGMRYFIRNSRQRRRRWRSTSTDMKTQPYTWQTLRVPRSSGRVVWMGLRPARLAPLLECRDIVCDPVSGLSGDHYGGRTQRKRQVTLIQHEHLAVISALTRNPVTPDQLRRNIVVAGINLLALNGTAFRVGAALLRGTGLCQPCSRMEAALGPGGYAAMLGHGGITAQILRGGHILIDDPVAPLQQELFDEARWVPGTPAEEHGP